MAVKNAKNERQNQHHPLRIGHRLHHYRSLGFRLGINRKIGNYAL